MSSERCRKAGISPGVFGSMADDSEASLSIGFRCLNVEALPVLTLFGHLIGHLSQKERSDDLRLMRIAYEPPRRGH